jgi:head-tail adaptor
MMSKQIILEQWETETDLKGNMSDVLLRRIPVWAEVKRIGGGRSGLNGQVQLDNRIEFKVHWKPNIYPSGNWRIVYNGRKHTVSSIEKMEEDKFYWIITAESKWIN